MSFPTSLDAASLINLGLGNATAAAFRDREYELAAILIHKGPSAHHGHYGALALC